MRNRAFAALVLLALAAVAVLAVLVLRVGQRNPSPPSLRDHPRDEISGSIAYLDENGCIQVALASGHSQQKLTCPGQVSALSWVDAKTVAYAPGFASGADWHEVDVATRQERQSSASAAYPKAPTTRSPRGTEAAATDADGSLSVIDGTKTKILDFNGPQPGPQFITWSPDGEWLLMGYEPKHELWIVRRDGSFAGTLAGNARVNYAPVSAAWWIDGFGSLPAR